MDKTSLESKSIEERTFLAMAELSSRIDQNGDSLDTDLIIDVAMNWTTDEVGEGIVTGEDATILFAGIVHHIMSHSEFRETAHLIGQLAQSLEAADLDPKKLVAQDPEEIERMQMAVAIGAQDLNALKSDLTLEDMFSELPDVASEDQIRAGENKRLLDLSNHKIIVERYTIQYLKEIIDGDHDAAHDLLDEIGCPITHALTSLLLHEIDISDDIEEWIEDQEMMLDTLDKLSDAEKIQHERKFESEDD